MKYTYTHWDILYDWHVDATIGARWHPFPNVYATLSIAWLRDEFWLCGEKGVKQMSTPKVWKHSKFSDRKELIAKPNIDGFLVGGASLKPSFMEIVTAVQWEPEIFGFLIFSPASMRTVV